MAMSEQLRQIRELVGSRELVLPSVAVLIQDDDGRLLLVRQRETKEWSTVGGIVESGEAPEEAAVREAREEIGAEVEAIELYGVFGGSGYRVTYPNGHKVAYVVVAYSARLSGPIQLDMEEVDEASWFAPADLLGKKVSALNVNLLRDIEFSTESST